MNKNAEEWCKALESGKYKQGRDALRTHDGYCCLGVACDISGLHRWTAYCYDGESCELPESVQEWLGLTTSNGEYPEEDSARSLSEENDTGATFKEIADIIRSEPEGLFQ